MAHHGLKPVATRKGTGHLAHEGSSKPLPGLRCLPLPFGGRERGMDWAAARSFPAEGIAAVALAFGTGSLAMTGLLSGESRGSEGIAASLPEGGFAGRSVGGLKRVIRNADRSDKIWRQVP
jgi:hypothetical protein